MDPGRHAKVTLVASLVALIAVTGVVTVGGVAGAAGASGVSASDSGAGSAVALAQSDVDADVVSLRAAVNEDGSATWRVTYRVELDDDNATAAFEDLRADVDADPTPYLERFGDRMERTARAAENATGREMAISNLSVSASRESLPQGEYGVVTYRLDWARFAATDGDRLVVGDAIDQFFLDERTALTITWPEAYGASSITPDATAADGDSVTWQGRRNFGPGEPRVTVVDDAATGGSNGAAGGDQSLVFVGAGLALLVFVVALGWVASRRFRDGGNPETGAVGDRSGAGDTTDDGDEAETAPGGPPPELLSNEERVLALLEERGGRLKQQQVAAELDWTDAKTSQVVGDLRDDGDLESFRLGRENVLTLPDVSIEPTADADGAETGNEEKSGESGAEK